jgi:beta-glucosidase
MKRNFFIIPVLLTVFLLSGGWRSESPSPEDEIDQKVEALLKKMSLLDKVGEMTQLTIDMLSVGQPYNLEEPHRLDSSKLREALVDLRVGSILNVGAHEYDLDHWHEVIGAIQRIATQEKPTGIPVLYGIDAIHGVNYTEGATLHPQQLGLASTWNPALAKQLAAMTAYETRASYIPWTFAPVLDIGRDPRWPRLWEGFGEDVYLAKQMGVAMVEGFEGDDLSNEYKVASCMKHFLGYSVTLRGKDRTQAWIPERQLREYFVPTFQAAVDAGASTVMICSGEMNGIPVHANRAILHDLLREEMGFEGLAVTDWGDIPYLFNRHHVAKDYKEAIKLAINAGIDMAMVPVDLEFPVLLKELVEEGEVPMSRIDESVRRILKLKFRLGLFENPIPTADYSKFASEEHSQLAYKAAQQSIILAKNESVLPLKKSARVLVAGPNANSLIPLNGGWTHTWQGDDENRQTKGKMTILEAIKGKVGASNVRFSPGTSLDKEIDIPAAVKAGKKSDVIVLCLGERSYTEVPGNINDLNLPAAQKKLVRELAKLNKPMVAIMSEGRPRIISEIESELDGILLAFYPGDEGGRAISDVLFGDFNPQGKLPITYPRHVNDLHTYDYKGTDLGGGEIKINPQFEFGHGLSYTTFETSGLNLNKKVYRKNDPIRVSFTLKNTGGREGVETVPVFVRDMVASITPSMKRLRGFAQVSLKAGESQKVEVSIPASELAFIGQDNEWTLEAGEFKVMVGEEEVKFELK